MEDEANNSPNELTTKKQQSKRPREEQLEDGELVSEDGPQLSPLSISAKRSRQEAIFVPSNDDLQPPDLNSSSRFENFTSKQQTATQLSCTVSELCDHTSKSEGTNTSSSPVNECGEDVAEIDRMLEESMHEGWKARGENPFETLTNGPDPNKATISKKVVLRNRAEEYFEVLPDGWIEITHRSGLPVYLHKGTRVCTLSRPYFLGPGSARNHDVPLSSIPCLHQKRLKQAETERPTSTLSSSSAQLARPTANALPNVPEAKVQTIEDYKARNLTSDELFEYAKSVFDFQTIDIVRFKTWADHRAYHKQLKRAKQMTHMAGTIVPLKGPTGEQLAHEANSEEEEPMNHSVGQNVSSALADTGRPKLPANVKLITVPEIDKHSRPHKRQFVLNPQGKSSITVLHEYVQKVLKGLVTYEFTETRNPVCPFTATVKLTTADNDLSRFADPSMKNDKTATCGNPKEGNSGPEKLQKCSIVGSGTGNSKKNAKMEAAKQALKVLIPGIEFDVDGIAGGGVNDKQDDVVELFDLIPITDSRVPELSIRTGQPTPFVILQECLKRNTGLGQVNIESKVERVKHQQHAFSMRVGKHEVRVICVNKREGKQKASQAMLERLHPQITTWGALIRLYGYGAQRRLQETRREKNEIIKLQTVNKHVSDKEHVEVRGPNKALLEKLKIEMRKLSDKQKQKNNGSKRTGAWWWDSSKEKQNVDKANSTYHLDGIPALQTEGSKLLGAIDL
ncbi:Microprocessor complex subunit DGCR8 [Trichuris trichiura]|uniref:Microprocessor complex subunit DGCR8 n=1 Tax=Trichuris trichiura TaxID=36087 RepID=A0A077ZFZ4_TRITR|nr:Microprocessor complex subunit DGCR8 [Trichuris trichiura]